MALRSRLGAGTPLEAARVLVRRVAAERSIPAAAGAVAVVAFVAYWRTLLPGVSFGDWAEMQSIPDELGLAHPTGYPLAILVGHAWSLLPIGSVAYRANLLSAVEVSLALAVAVLILGCLDVRAAVAAPVALVLGANATVWEAATTARVDSLHLLLVALVLHRVLVWQETGRRRDLNVLGLLIGLAFANHMLTATVAPFVALFALWAGRSKLWRRPADLATAGIWCLVGLALYLYIPIRASLGPDWAYGRFSTLSGLLNLVRGSMFARDMEFLRPDGWSNFIGHLDGLQALVVARWSPFLAAAGAGGWLLLWRRNAAFALQAAALLVVNLYVYVNYVGHLEHYLLLSWLLVAIGVAIAIDEAVDVFSRAARAASRRADVARATWREANATVGHGPPRGGAIALAVGLLVGVGLLVLPLSTAAANWSTSDRSRDRSGDAFVSEVFGELPPGAVLLTYWDAIEPLWYAHCIEGRRPDLTILSRPDPAAQGCQAVHSIDSSLVRSRPVYALLPFDRDLVFLSLSFRLQRVALIRSPYGEPVPQWNRPLVRLYPLG